MKPSFDPAELFPMPKTRGASFDRGSKQEKQSLSAARLLGQSRSLPQGKPSGGMSLLAVRVAR
jgi:hypothetical protein